MLGRPDVEIAPITTTVFDRAMTIRAVHSFKLGDSLHLAAATEARCDGFLTNDIRLSTFRRRPRGPALTTGRLFDSISITDESVP